MLKSPLFHFPFHQKCLHHQEKKILFFLIFSINNRYYYHVSHICNQFLRISQIFYPSAILFYSMHVSCRYIQLSIKGTLHTLIYVLDESKTNHLLCHINWHKLNKYDVFLLALIFLLSGNHFLWHDIKPIIFSNRITFYQNWGYNFSEAITC